MLYRDSRQTAKLVENWNDALPRDQLDGAEVQYDDLASWDAIFLKYWATWKGQKHSSFNPRCFFSLNKRCSKTSKSLYLCHKRATWCRKKASQHFENFVRGHPVEVTRCTQDLTYCTRLVKLLEAAVCMSHGAAHGQMIKGSKVIFNCQEKTKKLSSKAELGVDSKTQLAGPFVHLIKYLLLGGTFWTTLQNQRPQMPSSEEQSKKRTF